MKFAKQVRFEVIKPSYVGRVPDINSTEQLVATILFIDKTYVTKFSSDAWSAQYRPWILCHRLMLLLLRSLRLSISQISKTVSVTCYAYELKFFTWDNEDVSAIHCRPAAAWDCASQNDNCLGTAPETRKQSPQGWNGVKPQHSNTWSYLNTVPSHASVRWLLAAEFLIQRLFRERHPKATPQMRCH